jgi:hypothetical protein
MEGVSPGVPDLFIPDWLLWVEMKREKGGRVSPEQKDWISISTALDTIQWSEMDLMKLKLKC